MHQRTMNTATIPRDVELDSSQALRSSVKKRADGLMNYFLPAFYIGGFIFAFFYDTWFIAGTVGTLAIGVLLVWATIALGG